MSTNSYNVDDNKVIEDTVADGTCSTDRQSSTTTSNISTSCNISQTQQQSINDDKTSGGNDSVVNNQTPTKSISVQVVSTKKNNNAISTAGSTTGVGSKNGDIVITGIQKSPISNLNASSPRFPQHPNQSHHQRSPYTGGWWNVPPFFVPQNRNHPPKAPIQITIPPPPPQQPHHFQNKQAYRPGPSLPHPGAIPARIPVLHHKPVPGMLYHQGQRSPPPHNIMKNNVMYNHPGSPIHKINQNHGHYSHVFPTAVTNKKQRSSHTSSPTNVSAKNNIANIVGDKEAAPPINNEKIMTTLKEINTNQNDSETQQLQQQKQKEQHVNPSGINWQSQIQTRNSTLRSPNNQQNNVFHHTDKGDEKNDKEDNANLVLHSSTSTLSLHLPSTSAAYNDLLHTPNIEKNNDDEEESFEDDKTDIEAAIAFASFSARKKSDTMANNSCSLYDIASKSIKTHLSAMLQLLVKNIEIVKLILFSHNNSKDILWPGVQVGHAAIQCRCCKASKRYSLDALRDIESIVENLTLHHLLYCKNIPKNLKSDLQTFFSDLYRNDERPRLVSEIRVFCQHLISNIRQNKISKEIPLVKVKNSPVMRFSHSGGKFRSGRSAGRNKNLKRKMTNSRAVYLGDFGPYKPVGRIIGIKYSKAFDFGEA